jgi:nicotinamidase-related amidase
MSKFQDRTGKALLVIDVQNDVVGDAWRRGEVIENINTLVAKARQAGTPVIWVQHSDPYMEIGSEAWQIVPELVPMSNEPIIRKKYRSSFEETVLDETLAQLKVGHLFITGAQCDNCVRHTSHAAIERGYDISLVEDAHTTSDSEWDSQTLMADAIVDEINRAFDGYELPGRSTVIVSTAEVSF